MFIRRFFVPTSDFASSFRPFEKPVDKNVLIELIELIELIRYLTDIDQSKLWKFHLIAVYPTILMGLDLTIKKTVNNYV